MTSATRDDLTLANAFTVLRLVLIPVFGRAWLAGDDLLALWVFAVAAITDVIDGFLARYLDQESRLGALLDPLADKLLMLVAWLVGVTVGVVPLWAVACVVGRDVMIALGALGLVLAGRGRRGPGAWQPTRLGKYAMFLQSVAIAAAIVDAALAPVGLRPYVEAVMLLAALFAVVAFAQYAARTAGSVRAGPAGSAPGEV